MPSFGQPPLPKCFQDSACQASWPCKRDWPDISQDAACQGHKVADTLLLRASVVMWEVHSGICLTENWQQFHDEPLRPAIDCARIDTLRFVGHICSHRYPYQHGFPLLLLWNTMTGKHTHLHTQIISALHTCRHKHIYRQRCILSCKTKNANGAHTCIHA